MSRSSLRHLADAYLKGAGLGALADFITDRRSTRRTWHEIAAALEEETGGAVSVTYETVRRWHIELEADAADAVAS